jgi:membrane protease YdiL (CAAX protease family)
MNLINANEPKQFNMLQIILYHLLPGIPILLVVIVCTNPEYGFGLPIFLSLMIAIMVGLLPVELIILKLSAAKEGKKIKDIISFKEKMPISKTILWALPGFVFAILVFVLVSGIEHPLWTIFDWVPDWFSIDKYDPAATERGLLYVTIALSFVFNGLLGPLTEELYFRGFLLPRMNRLGKAAPLVNVVLFSLYHLFSPWENGTRILAMLPFVCIVWYKKNIRIGMITHCSSNTVSCIGTLIAVLSM